MSWKKLNRLLIAASAVGVLGFACADGEPKSVSNDENVNDKNQNTKNNDEPGLERQSQISLRSSTGQGVSEQYSGRFSIGTPSPAGEAHSDEYSVTVGVGPIVVGHEE